MTQHAHYSFPANLKRLLRRGLITAGILSPLVRQLTSSMREIGPQQQNARHTLLALKPERFRGDLEILSREFGFRILAFKKGWQQKLLELYWNEGLDFDRYINAPEGSPEARTQHRLARFLDTFLPRLFQRCSIDAVISAASYYVDDHDIGRAAQRAGYPYLVLFRECLTASRKERLQKERLFRSLGTFQGDRLLVHNEATRQAIVAAGYARPEQVEAPGCIRMDAFLHRLAQPRPPRQGPKRVILFSFVHCTGLAHLGNDFSPNRDVGFVRLFDQVHGRIGLLAQRHPEVEFVIKPKWGGETWLGEIETALDSVGLRSADLPNLRILPDVGAQDIILDSDVMLGFGSTTLLEAAVTGMPVIVPHFAEAADGTYAGHVLLEDEYDAFTVATSPEELERLVLAALERPEVPEAMMARRREVFERYVSPLNGRASEHYAEIITRAIEESRRTP